MKKFFIIVFAVIVLVIIIISGLFYFFQEKVIFYPDKLPQDYKFKFRSNFSEINIETPDGKNLNGLLFKAEEPNELIFYLHGNAGALDSWGDIARIYTGMGYDIFMVDYRGFGKSTGSIKSEKQMHDDIQLAYNEMKKLYDEDSIVVMGFSIGTGMASRLAAHNNPRILILQAPYYSMTDLIQKIAPYTASVLIRYKLENYKYLQQCAMPVTIFHGDKDEVIGVDSSERLKEYLKPSDHLIILRETNHNGITMNEHYQEKLKELLQLYKTN